MAGRKSSVRGVQQVTSVLVATTALLVGGVAVAASALGTSAAGVAAGAVAGAIVALLVGHLLARRAAVPRIKRVAALARRIRERAGTSFRGHPLEHPEDEEEFAEVVDAVEHLLRHAEERTGELENQAEVLRSLLEVSPNAVLITNANGQIRYMNPTFRRLVRLRADPMDRLPIEAIPVAEVQTVVDDALRGRSSEDVPCTSDPYDLVLQAVPTEDGGALVIAQDITRFQLAERARTDFVANVSHELRTPMTAILGFAEALLDDGDELPPDVIRIVDRIHRNARRLRDIFEDLLTLSRIEARRGELPVSERVLRPLLAEAVSTAADMAHERGIHFELKCKRKLTARCNPEALSAIVGNLAANACHYTESGGHVRVTVEQGDGEVRVEVADDGIGIDVAHHQRIFERFYRVDEGRSRRKGGTGLGLAIVKHLALASGSTVTVSSQSGQGSTFTLHLPAADDPDSSDLRGTVL